MSAELKPGKITISKTSKDVVEITLNDPLSATEFVTVHMSYQAFAQALLGLARMPCTFEYGDFDKVLKKLESKVVKVPLDQIDGCRGEAFSAKVTEWLLENGELEDGWMPYSVEPNHHRNKDGFYSAGLRRFIDSSEEDMAMAFKEAELYAFDLPFIIRDL